MAAVATGLRCIARALSPLGTRLWPGVQLVIARSIPSLLNPLQCGASVTWSAPYWKVPFWIYVQTFIADP